MIGTTTGGVKAATELAQSQYVFGILFILLLGGVLWYMKKTFDKMQEEKKEMNAKNDAVVEKIERMHEDRQNQLNVVIESNKQESKEREAQLMTHNNTLLSQLQIQTSSLEEITRTIAKMQESMSDLQDNMSKIEIKVEHLENK